MTKTDSTGLVSYLSVVPAEFDARLNETALVAQVKSARDNDALIALVNMHSGIYCQKVNQFAAAYPAVIRADDLRDDRFYNIYQFILDYQPDRKMKLCTYIGERTEYLCKNLLRRGRRNPLDNATEVHSDMEDGSLGRTQMTTDDTTVQSVIGGLVFADAAPSPRENADATLGLQQITTFVEHAPQLGVTLDHRFKDILTSRHCDESTEKTWRALGAEFNMTHEGVRKIYLKGMAKVRDYFQSHTTALA